MTSFGRPPVLDWTVAEVVEGPAHDCRPTWATRDSRYFPKGPFPTSLSRRPWHEPSSWSDTTHTGVVAIDTTAWTVCQFQLPTRRPDDGDGGLYEVLHLSRTAA